MHCQGRQRVIQRDVVSSEHGCPYYPWGRCDRIARSTLETSGRGIACCVHTALEQQHRLWFADNTTGKRRLTYYTL